MRRTRKPTSTSTERRSRRSGPKKYKITNGGFTTCVQPTPRWELHAGTVVLNIDHYTLLQQRGVQREGRADAVHAGPVLPDQEGRPGHRHPDTDLRLLDAARSVPAQRVLLGLDRSQDLTFEHDWYSKTGQGGGSEYRYNFGPGSNGDFRGNFLNQHSADYVGQDGTVTPSTASNSWELHGGANQVLPGNLRARAPGGLFLEPRADAVRPNELSPTRTRTSASFGGNVVGAWRSYSLNATVDHTDYFSSHDGLEHVRQLAQGGVVTRTNG